MAFMQITAQYKFETDDWIAVIECDDDFQSTPPEFRAPRACMAVEYAEIWWSSQEAPD